MEFLTNFWTPKMDHMEEKFEKQWYKSQIGVAERQMGLSRCECPETSRHPEDEKSH